MCSLRGCVVPMACGEPPSADSRRLRCAGDHRGAGSATAGASAENEIRFRPRCFPDLIDCEERIPWGAPRLHPNAAKPVSGMRAWKPPSTLECASSRCIDKGGNENRYLLHAV